MGHTSTNTASYKTTSYPVSFLVTTFFVLLSCVPVFLSIAPILFIDNFILKLVVLGVSPITFLIVFTLLAGLLSLPFQRAILPGKFPRDLQHFIYGPRRLYGFCWGAVFYFTPVYYALMSIPFLRASLLWLFGYRGTSTKVNIAPDAWLRDLPVLDLEEGVYIANKSTIGTNICLSDNTVIVDRIRLGKNTIIGHLAMVAAGTDIGEGSEVGVGCAIGIRVKIGKNTRIAPTTTINHGAKIGSNVDIGTMSYIGLKAIIADGIKIPGGANIPEGAEIQKQEDVNTYITSETRVLESHAADVARIFQTRLKKDAFVANVETVKS